MSRLVVAVTVLACVFVSALPGLYLRVLLPDHHLKGDSIGAINLVMPEANHMCDRSLHGWHG